MFEFRELDNIKEGVKTKNIIKDFSGFNEMMEYLIELNNDKGVLWFELDRQSFYMTVRAIVVDE